VNFHVENAKRKLGVGTRVQAVLVAVQSGIIG
jgi:DNA-binding CsgD family transcriptional regulator